MRDSVSKTDIAFYVREKSQLYSLEQNGRVLCENQPFDVLCEFLIERLNRVAVGSLSDFIALRGDAVRLPDGGAVLLFGEDFSGQSTLARTLTGMGAKEWCHQYILLDELGKVHRYPLECRGSSEGIDVNLVCRLNYKPGSFWELGKVTAGGTVVQLLSLLSRHYNVSKSALVSISCAVKEAQHIFSGVRGDVTGIGPEFKKIFDCLF